ncbi:MAG: L,D-transpeptidase family protein [Solirubrobacteraceae bacterium]
MRASKLTTLILALTVLAPLGSATAAASPTSASGTTRAIPVAPSEETTPTSAPGTPQIQETPQKPSPRTKIVQLPKSVVTDGTAPLRVRLSGVPAAESPPPALTPHVAGTWKTSGTYEVFTPASTLQPCSSYTLTVWAGTDATGDRPLGKARRVHLNVVCPGTLALQQALARLGYLPYTLHSSHRANGGTTPEPRALAAHYAFNPPRGPLVANIPHAPGLWYAHLDPTTRGALMVFQETRHLSVDGVAERSTWASLLATLTHGSRDPRPYTFVTVSERIPETLEVHEGRHVVLSTPANTGVSGATTQQGTFPIYSRFTSTTMTGTNPDGSKYSDPGVPWVNYFNGGDAVHGFPRPSYGTPQSNGCVELPISTAQRVFEKLSIGDLVIVSD